MGISWGAQIDLFLGNLANIRSLYRVRPTLPCSLGGRHEFPSGNMGHCHFAAAKMHRNDGPYTRSGVSGEPRRNNPCATNVKAVGLGVGVGLAEELLRIPLSTAFPGSTTQVAGFMRVRWT